MVGLLPCSRRPQRLHWHLPPCDLRRPAREHIRHQASQSPLLARLSDGITFSGCSNASQVRCPEAAVRQRRQVGRQRSLSTPQQQASCQRAFRLRRNRDAHSRRAPSRLVACVTDGSAVPFQAALAALIKGQRSTASSDAAAQSFSGRLMRSHVHFSVSPRRCAVLGRTARSAPSPTAVATQRLRNGNDADATTARADAASYESSPASSAAGRPLTTPKLPVTLIDHGRGAAAQPASVEGHRS